jgi:hypothetical protein
MARLYGIQWHGWYNVNSTLYAGLIAFAALASYGGAVAVYNRILHMRARMAARCFITE